MRLARGTTAVVGVAIATAGLLAVAGSATARIQQVTTKTSIAVVAGTPDRISGKISAPRAACKRSRSVTVKAGIPGPNPKLGSVVRSNRKGAWKLTGDFGIGLFDAQIYATVKVKTITSGGKKVKCKPARSKDVAVIGDRDGDGIPDSEDPCPNDYAPDGFCPHTIYELRNGSVGTGTPVRINNAWVSFADAGDNNAWTQVQAGDAAYLGPGYSAIRLDLTAVTGNLGGGERVSVAGVTTEAAGESVLEVSSVQVTGFDDVVSIPVVGGGLTLDDSLQGVLVQVEDVTIATTAAGIWTLDNGITIGSALIGALPADGEGTQFSAIRGIADSLGGGRIQPRDEADIVAVGDA